MNKHMKLIDAFRWGTSRYELIFTRRMRRNFFFYSLCGADADTISETGVSAPAMPEFIARFISDRYTTSNCTILDQMYFQRSRNKKIIFLYNDMFLSYKETAPFEDYVIGNSTLRDLCRPIYAAHEKKWKDLSDTYFYEYNPIENYNMEETEETADALIYEKTEEGETSGTRAASGNETETLNLREETENSETLTRNTTDTRTPATTRTETDSLKGFNSSAFVDADKKVTGETGTETMKRTGTETTAGTGEKTNTGTDATTRTDTETSSGTDSRTAAGEDNRTIERTLTRKGNIGVTTTQQMIQQQREIALQAFLTDVVFPDIDRALTLSVY